MNMLHSVRDSVRPAIRYLRRERAEAVARPIASRLGCVVVRRIIDRRGIEWTVRELPADAPQRSLGGAPEVILLFRSDVQSIRPEPREVDRPLEALDGDDLLQLLDGTIGRRRSA